MRRRGFITLVGGAAAWPMTAGAQRPAMSVIGFLYAGYAESVANRVAAFRKGLSEGGFVEGRNLAIEFRWAENDYGRLPQLAADLIHRRVDAIVASPEPAALAAKAATMTTPIIFFGGDPIGTGLVASLSRPGGNITGVATLNPEITTKRLGFLFDLLPTATQFAVLVNRDSTGAEAEIKEATGAAAMGRRVEVFTANNSREIDTAFAELKRKRADALLVGTGPLFINRRVQIVTLATYHRVPAMFFAREFADIGGLMSYGTNLAEQYRQVGIYTGRVLKGERPSDLPVMQPTKFEFVINMQTAKTLGIDVPAQLLASADEVIE